MANKRAEYYQENKQRLLAYQNQYNEDNRGYVYATNRARDANKKYGTPIPDEKELNKLAELYEEAIEKTRKTGIQHVVDHIHPLFAGGEHKAENCQVITQKENITKYHRSDKFLSKMNPHTVKSQPSTSPIVINIENLNIHICDGGEE